MKNMKNLLLILVGFILAIGISNAYKLNASEVTYDKKNSTLESNDVSGAVNELGILATTSMSEVKAKLDSIESLLLGSNGSSDANLYSMVNDIHDSLVGGFTPVAHISGAVNSVYGITYPNWVVDNSNIVTADGNKLTFNKQGVYLFTFSYNGYKETTTNFVTLMLNGTKLTELSHVPPQTLSVGSTITSCYLGDTDGSGRYKTFEVYIYAI